MFRNQIHDDNTSSRKRFKSFDNDGVASWLDVNDDVFFSVMMKLGFVDFFAFSGVCKSWRSFAISNRNMFMVSKPPMLICIDQYADYKAWWHLKDFEGRRFRITIPHSAWRSCVGCTCGYLILKTRYTHNFWLLNPITKHELYVPDFLFDVVDCERIKGILVFSPSISGWVFMLTRKKLFEGNLSFYVVDKPGWNHVSSSLPIIDLHFFKGKIYTLHSDCCLGELRLHPNQKNKWTLLETKTFPKTDLFLPELVSSGENLYVIDRCFPNKVLELDFGEMKWVSPEKTIGQFALFLSNNKSSAAINPESWSGPRTQYKSYDHFLDTNESQLHISDRKWMWYFPHDSLNVNILDE